MIEIHWVSAGMVSVLFVVMAVLRWIQLRYRWSAETVRKTLHVTMGLATLPLPWLVAPPVGALVLGTTCLIFFVVLRRVAGLQRRLGPVLWSVERATHGEFYFTAGVTATLILTGGEPVSYCVGIAILTVADPAAAIVGNRAHTGDARKTVRGSVAFAVVAAAAGVLVFAAAGLVISPRLFLVAGAVAVATAGVEAMGGQGIDNLTVPVAAALLVGVYVDASTTGLALHVGSAVLFGATVVAWRGRMRIEAPIGARRLTATHAGSEPDQA